MPAWGDKIIVRTAGRGVDKLFALREFQVENEQGDILVNAMSAWLLLDWETKRPKSPDRVLPSEMFQPLLNSLDTPPKIPSFENGQVALELEVRPSDLDMNNHVNNVSFIRWIEDYCILNKVNIAQLLINYKAEVMMGEKIILSASQKEETVFISGKQGNREVFTSRISK
jgi:medium-chain acyl-[acyl-carrier-protein] hydrolase